MDARLTAIAIPFFFLLIGVELVALRKDPDKRYRLHDAIASLSCGVGQQVLGAFLMLIPVGAYTLVYSHFRLTTLPATPVTWIVLFLGVDLAYWTWHWASHRVNFLWALHSIHHQSEELNLTTALRQPWFYLLASWVFYAPLALAGFSPEMFVTTYTLEILYGFWVHTRAVGRLGPLEWILNTPSHHRVHHGVNPEYIDRNHAGVLILWDKLFGTFAREEADPVYGTVEPLASWNPAWANIEPWFKLWKLSRSCRRLRDKVYAWVAPPEWRPAEQGGRVIVPQVSRATQRRYATPAPRLVNAYVLVGFVLAAATATLSLEVSRKLAWFENGSIIVLVLASLAVWSGLEERRSWAVPLELGKLAGAVALAAWLLRDHALRLPGIAVAAALACALGVWVVLCGRVNRDAPIYATPGAPASA
jgi:alkylglycerol monooxygenase